MKRYDTTQSFINSAVNSGGYTANDIVETQGYYVRGGVGGTKLMATGNVIAASQDFLALNDIKCSDASGNEFQLVVEEAGIIDLNTIGGVSAAYINIAVAAGLTYSQGLTSNPNVSDRYINATRSAMVNRVSPQIGEVYIVSDRADGIFDTVAVGTTPNVDLPNTYNIIVSTADAAICFVLRISDTLLSSQMGATGDGVTNDTNALKAFFDYCIDNTQKGFIDAGTYLITLGVLDFDNAQASVQFPIIETAGYNNVTFINAADIDSPFLKFTNGTALTATSFFYFGGHLGGITFSRTTGSATNTAQHGLVLRGFQNTDFGYMKADTIGGDCVYIDRLLFGGTNPDPYHVFNCDFAGIEANNNGGYLFNNDNYVGFNLCRVIRMRGVGCVSGGIRGLGAANTFKNVSMGSCLGWNIDGFRDLGANIRTVIESLEIDNPENGIRAQAVQYLSIKKCRIVHRYNSGHTENVYWPKIAVDIASGASENVANCDFEINHRIDAGGAKTDVGVITEFNSSGNIADVELNLSITDNAGFGFVDSDLYQNISASATGILIKNSQRQAFSNELLTGCIVSSSSSNDIPNSGFFTFAARVPFPTEVYDRGSYYTNLSGSISAFADGGGGQVVVTDVAHGLAESDIVTIIGTTSYNGSFVATSVTDDTFEITDTWVANDAAGTWTCDNFTVPHNGLYNFKATITFDPGVATLLRIGPGFGRATAINTPFYKTNTTVTGNQSFSVDTDLDLQAGDKVFLMAATNGASPIAMFSTGVANQWSIRAIQ